MFDNAYSDYTAGQYDLAIDGLQHVHQHVPEVDEGRRCAAEYRQCAVRRRPESYGSDRGVSESDLELSAGGQRGVAYYKMGLTYEALKQLDLARKAFETVIQKYPTAYEAILAKQRSMVKRRN